MKRLAPLLLVAVVWLLAGCSKPSLVGTWTFQQGQMNVEQTFNADNTMSQTVSGEIPGGQKMDIRASATYDLKENMLTVSNLKIESVSGVPKPFEDTVRKQAAEQLGKNMSGTIEFKDNNTLNLTIQGQSITLKRKGS